MTPWLTLPSCASLRLTSYESCHLYDASMIGVLLPHCHSYCLPANLSSPPFPRNTFRLRTAAAESFREPWKHD
ncbi:unnamed protein product [Closterium sp. Naga37s-1]|nr:unnamed protein product [Closterium sp. Naga37s-1]